MKKKGIIGIVLAVCLLLALASPALAGGLTVYGGKIETSVSPANDYSYTMKVANTSDAPMDIGVEVKGYGISSDRDFIVLEPKDDKSPYTGRELLTVSPTNFHLEPGDSQVITCTAKIPPGIGDGGRYAIVFIHTTPPKSEMVATISAIAARVLLTISGSKLDTNSEITEVSLAKATSQETAGVIVTVANNGNYHYNPQIKANLRNGDKVVAVASLTPGWPVIPGCSRQFTLSFVGEVPLPGGKYEVDVEVKEESGNLITKGTFPIEFIERHEVLPPEKASISPSPEPSITVTLPPSVPPAPPTEVSWPLIGGAAAAIIIIALLIALLVRRRAH